jgi:carbamoylphosphate synthase large subunit
MQNAERKLKTKRRKNKTKAEKRKTLMTLLVNKLMATSVAHSHHRHHSNNRPKKIQTVEKILKKESKHIYGLSPTLFLLPPPTSHSQTNSY